MAISLLRLHRLFRSVKCVLEWTSIRNKRSILHETMEDQSSESERVGASTFYLNMEEQTMEDHSSEPDQAGASTFYLNRDEQTMEEQTMKGQTMDKQIVEEQTMEEQSSEPSQTDTASLHQTPKEQTMEGQTSDPSKTDTASLYQSLKKGTVEGQTSDPSKTDTASLYLTLKEGTVEGPTSDPSKTDTASLYLTLKEQTMENQTMDEQTMEEQAELADDTDYLISSLVGDYYFEEENHESDTMEEMSRSNDSFKSKESSSNPLKKLKRKFNKLRSPHGGGSIKAAPSVPADDEFSDTGSVQSTTDVEEPVTVETTPPRNPLTHQESFQSTGTATSLLRRNLGDSSAYSSIDHGDGDHEPSLLESTLTAEAFKQDHFTHERSHSMDPLVLRGDGATDLFNQPASPGLKLELTIVSGCNLIARDKNGKSDPYVKVKYCDKTVHKTKTIDKTLDPTWEDTFTLPLQDIKHNVILRVYDHDRFSDDDFMGKCTINISQLEKDKPLDLRLDLTVDEEDGDETEYNMGFINIRCILHTQSSPLFLPESKTPSQSGGGLKVPHRMRAVLSRSVESLINIIKDSDISTAGEWDYIVRIVLVEGENLLSMDDNGLSDPYVRFKLQNEKYKTKVKAKTLNPKWLEMFSLHLHDRKNKSWNLDMRVYDHNIAGRADFMGRANYDLAQMEIDKTHDITVNLEDDAGSLRLLVTITGAVSSVDHEVGATARGNITRKYGLFNSFKHFSDVGWLQVKVIKANDLSSKDWNGQSDPFCTVELVNTMLQTHTSYSTLTPEWNRVFTMPVKDIHSVLEITVYDEDKDMKKEFIGKVAVPIIMIERGVPKWYGLKDRKLLTTVKGAILIELDMVFNHVKAAVRTFNPREEPVLKEEQKFKISLFKRNVNRVRAILGSLVEAKNFWQSLIDWDYPSKTIMAFIAFMVMVWNFELYMLPLTLIMLFMWCLIVMEIKGTDSRDKMAFETEIEDDDVDEEGDDKESKRSFRQYIDTVKSIGCTIQDVLGQIADFGESIKNAFNWTVPWLSVLAVVALSVITLILYMIPLRYLIFLWGINKFTKKLRKPNYIPNNEVLDYLSRVPSDVEKMMYKQVTPDVYNGEVDRGRTGSPQLRQRRVPRNR